MNDDGLRERTVTQSSWIVEYQLDNGMWSFFMKVFPSREEAEAFRQTHLDQRTRLVHHIWTAEVYELDQN